MKFKGKVWKFGNNIDTDAIIAARYLVTTDAKELGSHCMESIDEGFAKKVKSGDIIVGGSNFGCGSSREHAPLAIKGCGISCVIAESFARIFYRNSINMGLPIVESPEAARQIRVGDIVQVNVETGLIKNLSSNKIYKSKPYPEFIQQIIKQGGLLNWVKKSTRSR
jgi:3-isopropylmalate/(R)-2-methylmalate dehydratase small subunit